MGTWAFWHCYYFPECNHPSLRSFSVHFHQCSAHSLVCWGNSGSSWNKRASLLAKSRMIGKLTKSSFGHRPDGPHVQPRHHFLVNLIRGCSGQKDKWRTYHISQVWQWSQLCSCWQPWCSARHQQPVGAPGPWPGVSPSVHCCGGSVCD